jgi:hypothetical protein
MNTRDYPTLHLVSTRVKEKEQLIVRKDVGVNEHERLSIITLRHKLKLKTSAERLLKITLKTNRSTYFMFFFHVPDYFTDQYLLFLSVL